MTKMNKKTSCKGHQYCYWRNCCFYCSESTALPCFCPHFEMLTIWRNKTKAIVDCLLDWRVQFCTLLFLLDCSFHSYKAFFIGFDWKIKTYSRIKNTPKPVHGLFVFLFEIFYSTLSTVKFYWSACAILSNTFLLFFSKVTEDGLPKKTRPYIFTVIVVIQMQYNWIMGLDCTRGNYPKTLTCCYTAPAISWIKYSYWPYWYWPSPLNLPGSNRLADTGINYNPDLQGVSHATFILLKCASKEWQQIITDS